VRTVPIVGELRRLLLEHRLLTGRVSGGLVVEKAGEGVESGDSLAWRAEKAWKAAKLERVTMHSARHSYASLMILARVPITALSRFMGHTSITVTVDRYGHLYPSERQAAVGAFDALMSGGLADKSPDRAHRADGFLDARRRRLDPRRCTSGRRSGRTDQHESSVPGWRGGRRPRSCRGDPGAARDARGRPGDLSTAGDCRAAHGLHHRRRRSRRRRHRVARRSPATGARSADQCLRRGGGRRIERSAPDEPSLVP
jgi:Phage integrase family